MALICHLSLCSQRHIVVHVELVVVTTSRTMTLAYNTQQIMKFLAIQLIKYHV